MPGKPLKLDVTFDVPKVLAELGEEIKKRDALLRECRSFFAEAAGSSTRERWYGTMVEKIDEVLGIE